MSKYTQGDWTYSINKDTQAPAMLFVIDEDGVEIDVAEFEEWGGAHPEQIANARLLAAAAKLLEACEFAKAQIKKGSQKKALPILRAAIAATKG
jgi:hypothetical protein